MPSPWNRLSTAGQIATYLRGELARGRWSGTMPGQIRLADELGASRNSVEAALLQLEHEGVLVGRGPGRMRLIVSPDEKSSRTLRVAILDYEPLSLTEGYMAELLYSLTEAGHIGFFTESSLCELGMKIPRIRRMVEMTKADAWVVCSGSHEVLEWFAAQSAPIFAMFGRRSGLPIAAVGPDKAPALATATRALIECGHRRIVLLERQERRLQGPGTSERAFLAELAAHGIPTGPYHLLEWEESIDGFYTGLEALFRINPPTALIVDGVALFAATKEFLAGRGLRVPRDISLVCTDDDPSFAWCRPSVANIRWDTRPVVRRIVRWVANVSRGKKDLRQTLSPAVFVPGGTIGPVPSR